MPDEAAGGERGGDGGGAALLRELAGGEEVGGVEAGEFTGKGRGSLVEGVGGDVVAAGGVRRGESVEAGLTGGGAVELEDIAVEALAAGLGDDVDNGSGAGAVLGGEAVGEDGHLLYGVGGDVGEDGLAAPAVIRARSIDLEEGLAAARAIGSEEVLVHEHIPLVDGGAVGRVEQGEVGDTTVEKGRLLNLVCGEQIAELRFVGADIEHGASRGHGLARGSDRQSNADGGRVAAGETEECRGRREAFMTCAEFVVIATGQSGQEEASAGVGLGSAGKAIRLARDGQGRVRKARPGLVLHAAG